MGTDAFSKLFIQEASDFGSDQMAFDANFIIYPRWVEHQTFWKKYIINTFYFLQILPI